MGKVKRYYEELSEMNNWEEADNSCYHPNRHYQPEEKDTNTAESYNCEDCGEELPIPEVEYVSE
tara:strand:- start:649 stop:840 length:192 start_codon:yes stop_codon:yes gene_type:complete